MKTDMNAEMNAEMNTQNECRVCITSVEAPAAPRSADGRVRHLDHGMDTPTYEPVRGHRQTTRRDDSNQVIEHPIGHVLVESALVAKAPQIELQRLELHEQFVRYIGDADGGEVGLPRQRTETRELRGVTGDDVVTARVRVGDRLEVFAGLG